MFKIEDCNYDELQRIIKEIKLDLNGWKLIAKEYIEGTKKIYDENEKMVALLNFYFLDDERRKMFISFFEVFPEYRGKGIGKKIMEQFLEDFEGEVHLEPIDEESELFWKKCGFRSGSYLDRRKR